MKIEKWHQKEFLSAINNTKTFVIKQLFRFFILLNLLAGFFFIDIKQFLIIIYLPNKYLS
jgi:hypothetical protein